MTEDGWREGVLSRLTALEVRLGEVEKGNAVDGAHRDYVEKRLTSIEDTLKWLVRLIIGALVLGVIGFALKGGFTIA